MRKLMFMCMLMLGISMQAQDFDFGCGPAKTVVDPYNEGYTDGRMTHAIYLAGQGAALAALLDVQDSSGFSRTLCREVDGEIIDTQWLRDYVSDNRLNGLLITEVAFIEALLTYIDNNNLALSCD